MRWKFKLHILVLAVLSALVVRPVVVSLHNASLNFHQFQQNKAFSGVSQQITASHSVLRHLEKEAPDVTVLVAWTSKVKQASPSQNRLCVVSAFGITPPKSFLVLRI